MSSVVMTRAKVVREEAAAMAIVMATVIWVKVVTCPELLHRS